MIKVLRKSEIKAITGRSKIDDQIEELQHLGIDFVKRADGSLLVFEKDVWNIQSHHQKKRPTLQLENLQ